jgi:AraC-like DNA-binding protein
MSGSIFSQSDHFQHTPYDLEKQLVQAVTQADQIRALEILQKINQSGQKAILASNPLRSAKNSIICTCVLLTRAAISAGVSGESAFTLSDQVINRIEEFKDVSSVLNYEPTLVSKYIMLIKLLRQKVHPPAVVLTQSYIDAHLTDPITLKELAQFAKVNQSYLSRTFHREIGTTLKNYILERKIRASVYYVRFTNQPIAQIAFHFNFSDQSHYIAVFKRIMGITPGVFRNRAQSDETNVLPISGETFNAVAENVK